MGKQTTILLKLSEKMGLRGLEDECIVLEDERADDIYGWQVCLHLAITTTVHLAIVTKMVH